MKWTLRLCFIAEALIETDYSFNVGKRLPVSLGNNASLQQHHKTLIEISAYPPGRFRTDGR